jgi:hypothetical protein
MVEEESLVSPGSSATLSSPKPLPVAGMCATMETIATKGLPSWVRSVVPRLLRLRQLAADWDGRGSDPPSRWLVDQVLLHLEQTEIDNLPEPQVVPSCGGGVQLEWYMENREFEMDFRPDGAIEYLATDNQREQDFEGLLTTLDDVRSWLGWVVAMG